MHKLDTTTWWICTEIFNVLTWRKKKKESHSIGSKLICDPASQNQQKVAQHSFMLWLKIGDLGQHV